MLWKVEGKGKRGRTSKRWIDSIKKVMIQTLQELSWTVNDRAFQRSLIYKIVINWSGSMAYTNNKDEYKLS